MFVEGRISDSYFVVFAEMIGFSAWHGYGVKASMIVVKIQTASHEPPDLVLGFMRE